MQCIKWKFDAEYIKARSSFTSLKFSDGIRQDMAIFLHAPAE